MTAKELSCDLAVVGGGLAGLTAAVTAAERGLKVNIFERSAEDRYPCNSRFAGGAFHVAYTDPTSAPEDLLAAINRVTRDEASLDLAAAMAANAAARFIGSAITASIFRQAQHRCINSWLCRIDQCSRAWIGRIMAPTKC